MNKTWIITGVVLLGILIWIAVGLYFKWITPQPTYTIIDSDGSIEVREYTTQLYAEVEVIADNFSEASSRGFMQVADYIFGNNTQGVGSEKIAMTSPVIAQKSEKIAMTSPVLSQKDESGTYKVAFIMPEKYKNIEALPMPNNDRVNLRSVTGRKIVAIRFPGFFGNLGQTKKQEKKLLEWIESNGYTSISSPIYAGYDPPSTPPFLRRNEIMVEVK